ncbi:MAG: SMC family ATPase [Christensenellaceae bacterium]|jgi:exonuclease SbcC|nr:SMC family ATPase [Christensenellaceae bacterium]
MRPVNISICAFGCYAKQQNINFELLGKEGLYLICGNTGAGKTTIFDAIVFALYGVASGQNRKPDMLRCKQATEDDRTSVEFVFRYGETQEYRIIRTLSHLRKKKRGEGFLMTPASIELYLPDGRILTRASEVDNEIVKILGVNHDQFARVAMIAQGEFMKVLHSSTTERIETLRKIFNTEQYNQFQKIITNDSKILKEKLKAVRTNYQGELSAVEADLNDEVSLALINNIWKLGEAEYDRCPQLIEEIIDRDSRKIVQNENQRVELAGKLAKIHQEIGVAEHTEKIRKELDSAKFNLSLTESIMGDSIVVLNKAKLRTPELEQISKQIEEIEDSILDYMCLDNIKSSLRDKEYEATQNTEQFKKLRSEIERNISFLNTAKTEFNKMSVLDLEIANLNTENAKLTDLIERIKSVEIAYREYEILLKQYNIAQDKYKSDMELANAKSANFEQMNRVYLDAQAGVLAKELKSGQPCPVCGSTSHPKLATGNDAIPAKEDLDSAKIARDSANTVMERSAQIAHTLGGQVETKISDVHAQAKYILKDNMPFDDLVEYTRKMLACNEKRKMELDSELADKNRKAQGKFKLGVQIQRFESRISEDQKTLTELERIIFESSVYIQAYMKDIVETEQKLKFKSEAEAKNELDTLKQIKLEIMQELDSAQKNYEQDQKDLLEVKTKISTMEEYLSGRSVTDIEKLYYDRDAYDQALKTLNKLLDEEKIRTSNNKKILNEINRISGDLSSITAQYTWQNEVSETVSGSMGRSKVKLEAYVLEWYFDEIINRANIRLDQMTDGQYELIRRTDGNRQTQSGLDLNVIDHYNGTERDVKTLSGGESFLGALSLALGLADEIQSAAGGIRIDSMFVDEGFDTLDDNKMTQALNALTTVAHSDCLIGIISHVRGLDEKISRKIIVKKSRNGTSQAEIVID